MMEQQPQSKPAFRNLGLGLLMAIVLGVGLQPVFDQAWIPIVLGVFVGLIFFGGLYFRRQRTVSVPRLDRRPEPDQGE